MNIELLPWKFDVGALQGELSAHPETWNQHRWRTEHPRSPHREVDDIWLRYNAIENLGPHFNDAHESVWYPVARQLPSAVTLVDSVVDKAAATKLGGVLITRIPPGKQVYPHIDQGWHANYFEKIAVQIRGKEGQAFHFDGESLAAKDGEAYRFDNHFRHWVTNESNEDRITLIVCIRRGGH